MRRQAGARTRLFLSHASKDRAFVLSLTRILKQNKLRFWYSAIDIRGARQWHDEIGRALEECNWFLVVLTPDALRSQWVKRELLFALDEDRYHERIIPLLYKRCKYSRLSWTLPGFQLVDFTASFDDGCKHLLEIWGIPYKPKPDSPRPKPSRKKSR